MSILCLIGAAASVVLASAMDVQWWRAAINCLVLLNAGVQLRWLSSSGTVIDQDALRVRPFGGVRRCIPLADIAAVERPTKWDSRLRVQLKAGDVVALPHAEAGDLDEVRQLVTPTPVEPPGRD